MKRVATTRRRFRGRLPAAATVLLLGAAVAAAPLWAAEIRTVRRIIIVPPLESTPYKPVLSEVRLKDDLKSFIGRSCDPRAIEETLARRYRDLGYVPTIEATCDDGSLDAFVRESSYRIDLITFDAQDLSRIGMSPDKEFEEAHRLYPVPRNAPRALLRGLLQTREGDLYNFERYKTDRDALGRLGYTAAFIAGAAQGSRSYPPGAYLIMSLKPSPEERAYYTRETNYLGGTGSYEPRGGPQVGLNYQKDEVFGQFDRLTLSPSYSTSLGGELAYRSPVLAASEEPRRLYDIQANLYSDFYHNRLLEGVTTDERRAGVGATIGIRPLALHAPNSLRLEIGIRHERIDLGAPVPGDNGENLTIVRLAATNEWRHTYRSPSLSARFAPTLDVSIDRLAGQRNFVRPGLDATLHGRLRSGFESDFHFLGGTLDRNVPTTELWSLGGPTTVRGFREDTALGRSMAALQSELWFRLFRPRIHGTGEDAALPSDEPETSAPFEPRAGRLLKGAIFLDGGAASGTADGRNASIYGAGIGLRFVVPREPLVIRLDFGRGLGARGGKSYPYLSLAYRF